SVYSAMVWVSSTASSSIDTTLATGPTLLAPQFDPHPVVLQPVYVDDIVLSLRLLLRGCKPHLTRRHRIRNVRLWICVVDRHGTKKHPEVGRVQLIQERSIPQNENYGVLLVDGSCREVLLPP